MSLYCTSASVRSPLRFFHLPFYQPTTRRSSPYDHGLLANPNCGIVFQAHTGIALHITVPPNSPGNKATPPPPTGTERTSLRKEHRCRDHRRGVSLFIPPGSKPPRSGLLNKGTLLRVGLPLICSRVRPQLLVLHLLKLDFIRRHVLCFTITLPALTVSAALF